MAEGGPGVRRAPSSHERGPQEGTQGLASNSALLHSRENGTSSLQVHFYFKGSKGTKEIPPLFLQDPKPGTAHFFPQTEFWIILSCWGGTVLAPHPAVPLPPTE